jgi:hypothetical protein
MRRSPGARSGLPLLLLLDELEVGCVDESFGVPFRVEDHPMVVPLVAKNPALSFAPDAIFGPVHRPQPHQMRIPEANPKAQYFIPQ